MRNPVLLGIILFVVGFAFAREIKIAYFDSEKLRNEWSEWKDAQAKFDQEVAQWQSKAQGLEDEINAMLEEYQRQELLLSDDKKQEKQMLIQQKQQEYQQFLSSIFSDGGRAAQRNAELTAPLYEKINKALARISDREGYVVVFDAASSGIAYIDPSLDITETLIQELK